MNQPEQIQAQDLAQIVSIGTDAYNYLSLAMDKPASEVRTMVENGKINRYPKALRAFQQMMRTMKVHRLVLSDN